MATKQSGIFILISADKVQSLLEVSHQTRAAADRGIQFTNRRGWKIKDSHTTLPYIEHASRPLPIYMIALFGITSALTIIQWAVDSYCFCRISHTLYFTSMMFWSQEVPKRSKHGILRRSTQLNPSEIYMSTFLQRIWGTDLLGKDFTKHPRLWKQSNLHQHPRIRSFIPGSPVVLWLHSSPSTH